MGRLPSINSSDNFDITAEDDVPSNDAIDWRTKGAVNAVQNQGGCGSCWAFSSTAAMEGGHKIKKGVLLKLSESQLVDCDKASSGCNGGLETNAFKYLKSNGQELRSDYPYVAKTGTCKYAAAKAKVHALSSEGSKPVLLL